MISRKTGIIGTLAILIIAVELASSAGTLGSAQNAAMSQNTIRPSAASQTPLTLNLTLTGAGATFPAPLLFNWTYEYHLTHPNVTISYNAVGSGKGQSTALNKTADFAASDAPLSTRQLSLYPGILHIPETIGSVTLAYNIPGVPRGNLNLTGIVAANIFLGNILNWNDSAIRSLNPGLARANLLPNQTIKTAHRSDGSGTTFVFTSYLCAESPLWCSKVGNGTSVTWPVGTGAKGNGGVATYVNSTTYALGYVELQYVEHGNMTYANLQNHAGNFILPTLQSTFWAVSNFTATRTVPAADGDWSHVSMLNMPGPRTYPMASFTYLLVYKEQNVNPDMDLKDKVQFQALTSFLNWAVTTGQIYAPGNTYVQLPASIVAIDQAGINSMAYTEVSAPVTRNISLNIGASGFNGTQPGPSITLVTGDNVNLKLNNLDGAHHEWYTDFNKDSIQDGNETYITCSSSSPGITPCSFTPTILNTRSIPAAGTFIYRDNNTGATGSITVLPQQVAAVIQAPHLAVDLNSAALPTLDSSRVATVGSILVDMRTNIASQNVTVVAADKSTAALTYSHTYSIPNLQLGTVSGVTGLGLRFVLNIVVGPYALSTNILIQLQGTQTITSSSLTRELDMNGRGSVDITDVGTCLSAYGTTIGNPGYNPLADLNGSGTINILGLGPLFANYGYKVFYS